MQLSHVWEFVVLGLTIGLTLGALFYFFGVYSGALPRCFESMID